METIEELINNAEHIGSAPDMYHPEYGWIRIDGKLTESGKQYFQDQLEKYQVTNNYSGRA